MNSQTTVRAKRPRLTPRQKDQLYAVWKHWGECFHAPPLPAWLVRDATVAEAQAERAREKAELAATRFKLLAAAHAADYKTAKQLADHAAYLQSNLAEAQDDCHLYCLTDDARAIAATLDCCNYEVSEEKKS